ncbi:hypothetical protein [Salinicola rhizosphaerae]|uniref:hypothetical protein n=1 Tax=Salinicola rhizosphaerae TaxID=1443141 RepID=UPI0016724E4C|nr:hypothetical protein [Salinicola rhizosphaerae]
MSRMSDEREKLRKFRELDDAFSQALRALDAGKSGVPEVSHEAAPRTDFEDRLKALMQEYALSQACVHRMLTTLVEYQRIA